MINDWQKLVNDWQSIAGNEPHACGCIGPQNGQPLCPCMMRGVTIENGQYVQRRVLGPVPSQRKGEFWELPPMASKATPHTD